MTTQNGKVVPLADAVDGHVRPGDVVHVVVGHSRWTAASYELCRRFWRRDPGFTLVMLSLSSLGTLFFRGGLVHKVVTGYSGDSFPNFTPNPVFAGAYRSGAVEVENWSFLALVQRLEAAARGLPAAVTRSIAGSSMEANTGYTRVPSPFAGSELGLVSPLVPDIALLHGVVADREGNVVLNPPLLEGVWGALAARRGAVATVEKVVEDIRPWAHLAVLPAHRVAAVAEVPMGAHPGGLFARGLPVEAYGEDYDFWIDVRNASRRDDFDDWIRQWVLDVGSHDDYVKRLGGERVAALRSKAVPESWVADAQAYPPDLDAPPNGWEVAAVLGARYLAERAVAIDADAVLAGAGVANLTAWLGVVKARAAGSDVRLTAELGMWGYEPTPADPYVFNQRNFPTALGLSDASAVLGMLVGGPGTTTIGCLGAAQIDRYGNINSTTVPGGPYLVGSGGGNDVASTAAECVVVATMTVGRTRPELGFVTSPGRAVRALVTDLGVLEKVAGELTLVAVAAGVTVDAARTACGWDLKVADRVDELAAPTSEEVGALRRWDPRGWFLRS